MRIERNDFDRAVAEGLISKETASSLWELLSSSKRTSQNSDAATVASYFGALVVIIAMVLFLGLSWERTGGAGILAISSVYLIVFAAWGWHLWFRKHLTVAGGLLTTVAVFMVPLAIYGFQRMTGLWPSGDPGPVVSLHQWVRSGWLPIELGTLLATLLALRFIPFPFLTLPLAGTLFYLAMDITPLIAGGADVTWTLRCQVSIVFGLTVLVTALVVDRWQKPGRGDFAFWLYLSGLLTFWGGITCLPVESEPVRLLVALVNALLVGTGVLLHRQQFIVFGGAGLFIYCCYLAYNLFRDSLIFPIALSLVGVLFVVLGLQLQTKADRIEKVVRRLIPKALLPLLPHKGSAEQPK